MDMGKEVRKWTCKIGATHLAILTIDAGWTITGPDIYDGITAFFYPPNETNFAVEFSYEHMYPHSDTFDKIAGSYLLFENKPEHSEDSSIHGLSSRTIIYSNLHVNIPWTCKRVIVIFDEWWASLMYSAPTADFERYIKSADDLMRSLAITKITK